MPRQDPQTRMQAILLESCARNLSAEVRREIEDRKVVTTRARLLELEDAVIHLDPPRDLSALQEGSPCEVHFTLNDVRYAFATHVVRRVAADAAADTAARLVLARPEEVSEHQRRRHFRVSVLGDDPVRVDLHIAMSDGTGTCPIDARRYEGGLVNLSVGGAGVCLDAAATDLAEGDQLFLTFRLPGETEIFYFLPEVAQRWHLPDDDAERLGLRIKSWPDCRAIERTQQRLQRYITAVQREQLRRAG